MATAHEIVMENRKKLVNCIIENMKKGYVWSPKAWDSTALSPYNPTSNCHYLGGNRVRLMMAAIEQEYQDPRWCTFEQAQRNGWSVQRGAKSVLLEKWIFDETKTIEDSQGNKVEIKEPLNKPKVFYFRVFNAEQIRGIPKLEATTAMRTDPELWKIAETMLKSSQCAILQNGGDKCFYSPKRDQITLTSRYAFKSAEAFLSVAAHEMSHSTGHPSRLNRPLVNKFGTPDYAREELRAELGAALFKCDLQLPLSPEQLQDHSNYLSSWIKVLQEDPNEFFRACRDAEKISSYLHENYENTLEIETHITTELTANNLKPEGELLHKMQTLCEEAGKDLTLKEISEMAQQPQAELDPRELALAKEIIYLKDLSKECLAGMDAAGYDWIETPPESLGTVTFRHRETGECVSSDGWKGISDYLQETIQNQEAIMPPKTVQMETASPVEFSKVSQIVADLADNNFTANATLVKNIHSLCQHTGKELTLREISEMAKNPPKDPFSRELLEEIQSECCRQELAVQAINEFAVEPL